MPTRARRRDAGVTLTELAIALGLTGLVLLGVLALWERAQHAFFVGAEAAEAQASIRTALDLMVREIRAAGRDVTRCAFDYAALGSRDCTAEKAAACQTRLGPDYPAAGCQGIFAIPLGDATATTLRVRADRNDTGTVAGTPSASPADLAEESVLYALSAGSPPCPPGVSPCLTRDDGGGPMAMVAVPIASFSLTYYPRPGYPPCDGQPVPSPCPPFADLASQRDADNIGRIRISLTTRLSGGGQGLTRTVETDVLLRNRP
jgi:hypothetical protein